MGAFQSKKKYDVATGESTIKIRNQAPRNEEKREQLSRISQQIETLNKGNGQPFQVERDVDGVVEEVVKEEINANKESLVDAQQEKVINSEDEGSVSVETVEVPTPAEEYPQEDQRCIIRNESETEQNPTPVEQYHQDDELQIITPVSKDESLQEEVDAKHDDQKLLMVSFINEERNATNTISATPLCNTPSELVIEETKTPSGDPVEITELTGVARFEEVVDEDPKTILNNPAETTELTKVPSEEPASPVENEEPKTNSDNPLEIFEPVKVTNCEEITVIQNPVSEPNPTKLDEKENIVSTEEREAITVLNDAITDAVSGTEQPGESVVQTGSPNSNDHSRKRVVMGDPPTETEINLDENKESTLTSKPASDISHIYLETINSDDVHYTLDKLHLMDEQIHTTRARILSIKEID